MYSSGVAGAIVLAMLANLPLESGWSDKLWKMIQREGDWWYEARDIGDDGRSFDIAFWQAQGPSAIFDAAWQLVVESVKIKGGNPDELRLQKTFGRAVGYDDA